MQRSTRAAASKSVLRLPWLPALRDWLAAELRAWLAPLRDPRLGLLLGALALLLLLAAQMPLHYRIQVGQEDGVGADLPLLLRFNTPERDDHGRFRWTSERSLITLPGLGQRPVELRLLVFPVSAEVAQAGPKSLSLFADGLPYAELPVRPEGAIYHLALPPAALAGGQIEIRSTTFSPPGDPRRLGMPLNRVDVDGLATGLVWPQFGLLLRWLLGLLLLWLLLGRLGFAGTAALGLLLPLTLLLALASALDPPRAALGVRPLIESVACCLVLATVLCWSLPALAQRMALPLEPWALRWLLLLIVLVVGLRYGAKLYPYAMPGDIGFHVNRSNDVLVRGQFILVIPHRGVDFPYPPSIYLLTAPLRLLGLPADRLLQFSAALLDGLSVVLIYALVLRAWQQAGRRPWPRLGLLAAAIYGLTAAGFMAYWWNFSTFIFSQFAWLLLVTLLVLLWPALSGQAPAGGAQGRRLRLLALSGALLLFLLSHSTALLNGALVGASGVALLLLRWRRPWARAALVPVLLSATLACGLAVLIYYSNYLGLLLQQFAQVANGGLTGLAGREAVPAAVLWHTLWYDGLITHFGFFPLPLAFAGLLLLQERLGAGGHRISLLPFLIGITFLIGLGFALLPFISGSTLATRWLMFAAWAVAVAAALAALLCWQRGRAGKVVVLAMAAFVLWITLAQWLAALAWRIRPPEPF